MTQRLRVLLLVAAMALFVAIAAAATAPERAGAEKCNPACLPSEEPPEEKETPPPLPSPAPSMLVINVGWTTAYSATSAPLVQGALDQYVTYLKGPFNEWMARSAPTGFRKWTVTAGGAFQIPPPPIPADYNHCSYADSEAAFKSIADAAEARARERGLNPDAYSMVVVGWSRSFCQFGGISIGRRIGIVYPNQALHEFGHYLGLKNHANALTCRDAAGAPVPLSGSCKEERYADHYDSMGSISAYSYDAIHTYALGWLGGQYFDVAAGPTTQTVTLRPFTDPLHTQRALRLRDGATTLWLEYRLPVGIDGPEFGSSEYLVQPGLVIHRESSAGGLPQSQLLDMTPGSPRGFDDAPLPVGRTWANPLGEMKIRLDSLTPTGATVTISSQKVTVPDVRGFTAAKAESTLLGAGLKPTGWGSIVDPTCAYIGLVAATSPTGGARVLPGTTVTVAMGTKDPTRPCQ
jgi:hypothetical protein